MVKNTSTYVSVEVSVCKQADKPLKHEPCRYGYTLTTVVSHHRLHDTHGPGMSLAQHLAHQPDTSHNTVHRSIVVTRQQFLCNLFEDKERLTLVKTLLKKKQYNTIHPLTVRYVWVVYCEFLKNARQPDPHLTVESVLFGLIYVARDVRAETCSVDIFFDLLLGFGRQFKLFEFLVE
jgi:hypothetical protein